ncbi:MAG TPA: DUF2269 family protein [Candidatus Limnocylindrales bacterium]|jgi:uncharacterized membrane protein
MPPLFTLLLFVHVLAAIVAFGPTFAFPIIGSMGGAEPQHANFATRITATVTDRLVEPFALSMPVTGLLMVWVGNINLLATRWLLVAIVLYVIAISYSVLVQRRTVLRIVELSGGHGGPPIPALASPGPGAMGGPPPELMAAVAKAQRGGMFLGLMVVVLVFLMVAKPF